MAGVYEDFLQAVRADGRRHLDALVSHGGARGTDARGLLREGFADDEILDAAATEKADLIVLGTHGRRGPARLPIGSVASRVVCRSLRPVITVRTALANARKPGDA